jgi:AraC-like DNA-binding protein
MIFAHPRMSGLDYATVEYPTTVYTLRTPAPPLRRFIEHYWFVTHDEGVPVDLRVQVFVDARADLIFNFGAPYFREVLGSDGPAVVEHSHTNLDAQRVEPIRIHQRGLVRIAGVRFRLGGLAPFASGPLRPFTGCTPPPSEVLGPDALALEHALANSFDIDVQAERLDAFFVDHLVLASSYADFERILDQLVASQGGASIHELARDADMSSRHVDRLFARYLGIAPKMVARILRFQRALLALMRDPGHPLAEVAATAGYFDQAHFIRDFKRMSGGVPRGYRGYFPAQGPDDFAPNVVVFVQDEPPDHDGTSTRDAR